MPTVICAMSPRLLYQEEISVPCGDVHSSDILQLMKCFRDVVHDSTCMCPSSCSVKCYFSSHNLYIYKLIHNLFDCSSQLVC